MQTRNEKIVQFDDEGNAILTQEELVQLIRQTGYLSVFSNAETLPDNCYMLIDQRLGEAHLLPMEEWEEWEKDGSCEPGDQLYKIEFVKKY